MLTSRLSMLLCGACAISVAAPAAAQEAGSQPESLATQAIEAVPDDASGEIIVTAQRRAESIQSTPLSITASRGEDLRGRQITDIGGLSNLVPNVTIPVGVGPVKIAMRGISVQGTAANAEAPVAVSVDGVFTCLCCAFEV